MNRASRIKASDSAKIRKIILEYDESGLQQDAKKGNAFASANVFHHMRGDKKYVGVQLINGRKLNKIIYDEYRCALGLTSSDQKKVKAAKDELSTDKYTNEQKEEINEIANSIREEINNCVLISSEFHNWLTHRINYQSETLTFRNISYNLHDREDYYILYDKFTKDKACINKVTKCKFDETGLINALQSISRLKGCINDRLNINSKNIVQKLHVLFDEIDQNIKENNIYTTPSNK